VDTPLIEDMPLPLVDRVGKLTGVTLYRVPSTISQAVATTVATVASRLEAHLSKHQGNRVAVKHRWLTVRVAHYYSVSHNEWFLDRFLAISRSTWDTGKKFIFSLLSKFVAKMDAYNRFVYGQVCLQTHWLLTRGPKSVPRDKSFCWRKGTSPGKLPWLFPDRANLRRLAFSYTLLDISGLQGRSFLYRPSPVPLGPKRPDA
jgi:hypothetical protein